MGTRRRLSLAVALCAAAAPVWAASDTCRADHVDVRGEWGSVRFGVELAITRQEQARGLMFREDLGPTEGMLFVYDEVEPVSFWMRNTLIPLDMIFVDEAGTVTKVHADAVPGDETPIPSDGPVRAVLEVPAGTAERFGIAPGDELRSPVLPQDEAAWACPDR